MQRDLDEQREIGLTGNYVEMRKMTWPVCMSDKSVFDTTYNILSIPTFVIIDREGNIRFVHSAAGQMKQKRRIIEKLL
jgi:hypothetical protein